jgi:cyanophycinase
MNQPQGRLFIIGGAERKRADKKEDSLQEKLKVLGRMMTEMKGTETRLEIIPTASAIPNVIAPEYVEVFADMGCKNVGIMNIRTPRQANKTEYLERLRNADGILFTGGDQNKISTAFLGSEFHKILKFRYHNEPRFLIAGTSAGAMMMSDVMITGGQPADALMRGAALLKTGLGLLPNTVIDSHFVERGRFGRLAAAVAEHPQLTGIGLSEDTAILVSGARRIEVVGSGLVCIYDGRQMIYNSTATQKKAPLAFENMRFHLLAQGLNYDMESGKCCE